MNQEYRGMLEEIKHSKQTIPNPKTGELMEVDTFSGKELLWREANEENDQS
ncbi:hypothetical protein [Ammoniphilus sp. YIM 78166]|uniref:hypothetical protein n=1 Tax=Ammoniphilus sp. YIM 78166 TaxID=1644106 RepID=UPI00143082F4|nr:hypothetical protein [Ammoniphilus sp. YIM 78166]